MPTIVIAILMVTIIGLLMERLLLRPKRKETTLDHTVNYGLEEQIHTRVR